MRTRIGVVLVVGLLLAADAPEDGAKGELKKVDGTWTARLVEHKGKKLSLPNWTLVIRGYKYTLTGPKVNDKEMTEKGTIRLDPTTKPKTVDLKPVQAGEKTRLGIYELDGDRAKACFSPLGGKDRPKALAAGAQGDEYLWEFERNAKEIGRILLNAELRIMDGEEPKEKQPNRILLIDPESGEWKRVGDTNRVYPKLSPDGKTIAFGNPAESGIWTCAVDGGNLNQVFDKGNSAVWTADGKHLIVTKQAHDGKTWKFETWQIDADGSNAKELPLPSTDAANDCSPDGKWIATISLRPQPFRVSGFQIYVMGPDAKNERLVTQGGAYIDPRFSPDSKAVLYTGFERGTYKAFTAVIQGGKPTEIYHQENRGVGVPVSACWSPDGKRIAMVVHDWERTEKGELVLKDPEKGNYRIILMDHQGQSSKQLKLKNARIIRCDKPEWR